MLYDSMISYNIECNNVSYNVESITVVSHNVGFQCYYDKTAIDSIFAKWLYPIMMFSSTIVSNNILLFNIIR